MIETIEQAQKPVPPGTPGCPRQIAVTHVITSLATGGAELTLHRLLGAMDGSRFRSSVITLADEGVLANKIRDLGVPVRALALHSRGAFSAVWKLARELRRSRPDIVQTWMYHSDLLGGIASLALPGVPVVWNIRCGRLDPAIDKRTTIWVGCACAIASRALPARIVCCSHSCLENHTAARYARAKMRVVHNGFDTDAFRPAPHFRRQVRQELEVPPEALLIGLVARFDGTKDHSTFCEAAHLVNQARPNVHFLLCGEGITQTNPKLATYLTPLESPLSFHLLGRRDDIPRIMAALDIAVSSSVIEGFSNAIGEAMSSAVPCVATDTGDSRFLIGETGFVVPVRDPVALAGSILKLIDLGAEGRERLGAQARRRIIEHFSLAACARQYEQIYQELMPACAA
jgi:glycosyltransferase involved in cell wall biosynthesis